MLKTILSIAVIAQQLLGSNANLVNNKTDNGTITCATNSTQLYYLSAGTYGYFDFEVAHFTKQVVIHTCGSHGLYGFDTKMYLFNSSGGEVGYNDDHSGYCGSGDTYSSAITMVHMAADNYTIRIQEWSSSGYGTYTIGVDCVNDTTTTTTTTPPWMNEDDVLHCGDVVYSGYYNETDYWLINIVGERSTVAIHTCGSYYDNGFNTVLSLYESTNDDFLGPWEYMGYSTYAGTNCPTTGDHWSSYLSSTNTSGRFNARVYEYYQFFYGYSAYGNYTLTVECSDPLESTTTTTATPSSSGVLTCETDGTDELYFAEDEVSEWTFTLAHYTREIVFHTCDSYADHGTDTIMYVYYQLANGTWLLMAENDENYNYWTGVQYCDTSLDFSSSYVNISDAPAGEYFVQVYEYFGDSGTFYLGVECENETTTEVTTTETPIEYEPTVLSCGDYVSNYSWNAEDQSWKLRVIGERAWIRIDTCDSYILNGFDTVLVVYRENSMYDNFTQVGYSDLGYGCPLYSYGDSYSSVVWLNNTSGVFHIYVSEWYAFWYGTTPSSYMYNLNISCSDFEGTTTTTTTETPSYMPTADSTTTLEPTTVNETRSPTVEPTVAADVPTDDTGDQSLGVRVGVYYSIGMQVMLVVMLVMKALL